jgi:hypothetical protein
VLLGFALYELVTYFILGVVGVLTASSFSAFFAENNFCCDEELCNIIK